MTFGMSLSSSSSTSSVNSTISSTNQTYCDVALFNLPPSIYLDSIPQIINGVCPDTIFTPISSSLVLLNHLIIVFVGLVGVLYKRKNNHIIYRSPVYLYWSMFASTLLVGISCLRFMIGRKIFPCPLHAVTFFIFPQVVMMPSILKCLRVFLLYRINLEKTKVHKEARFSIAVKEKGIELEQKKIGDDSPTVGSSEMNTSLSNFSAIAMDDDRSSEAGDQLSEISTTQTRKIKILEFLASTKFATIIYVTFLIFHLCFWLIFSGIDQAITNSGKPGKTLVLEVGLLDFTKGCVSSSNAVLLVAAQCIFYLIIEIIVFVLFAFFTDRDTWGMKRETFVLISFQVVAAILYIVLGSIGIIKTLVDFFVAYAHVILIYVGLELCINVVAPVGYAFLMDWKQGRREDMDSVGGFLQDKKNLEQLLDFARRSYCPENVLFWRDVQRFKKSNKKNRNKMAKVLINTYMKQTSPVELNLPGELTKLIPALEQQIEGSQIVDVNFFQQFEVHCLNDLYDIFKRFKSSSKYGNS